MLDMNSIIRLYKIAKKEIHETGKSSIIDEAGFKKLENNLRMYLEKQNKYLGYLLGNVTLESPFSLPSSIHSECDLKPDLDIQALSESIDNEIKRIEAEEK